MTRREGPDELARREGTRRRQDPPLRDGEVGSVLCAPEVHEPVWFPGCAAVGGECLVPAGGCVGHFVPGEPDLDGLAVQDVFGGEGSSPLIERAVDVSTLGFTDEGVPFGAPNETLPQPTMFNPPPSHQKVEVVASVPPGILFSV